MMRLEPAQPADAPRLAALVHHYAERNIMLFRSAESIAAAPRDWVVMAQYPPTDVGVRRVLGGGSLVPLTPELVELRSLVVDSEWQGRQLGTRIVGRLIELGRKRGYQQMCALTLSPQFFVRMGFTLVEMIQLSPKVWRDCVHCPKYQCCDEHPMLLDLVPNPRQQDFSNGVPVPLPRRDETARPAITLMP